MAEKRKRSDENFTQFYERMRIAKNDESESAKLVRCENIAKNIKKELEGKLEAVIMNIPKEEFIVGGKHFLDLDENSDAEWVNSDPRKEKFLSFINGALEVHLKMHFDVSISSYDMGHNMAQLRYSVLFWPLDK